VKRAPEKSNLGKIPSSGQSWIEVEKFIGMGFKLWKL